MGPPPSLHCEKGRTGGTGIESREDSCTSRERWSIFFTVCEILLTLIMLKIMLTFPFESKRTSKRKD